MIEAWNKRQCEAIGDGRKQKWERKSGGKVLPGSLSNLSLTDGC